MVQFANPIQFGNDFFRLPFGSFSNFPQGQFAFRGDASAGGQGGPGAGSGAGGQGSGGSPGGGGTIGDSQGVGIGDSQGNAIGSGGMHGNSPGAGSFNPGVVTEFNLNNPAAFALGPVMGGLASLGGLQGTPGSGSPNAGQGDGGGIQVDPVTGQVVPTVTPGNFSNLEEAGLFGANQAFNLFNQGPQALFPGSGVAGFGDTSTQAQNQLQALATGNPHLAGATQQVANVTTANNPFLQSLNDFDSENPFIRGFTGFSDRQNQFLDSAFDRGADRIQDRLNSQFGRAGRSNSGFHSKTIGDSLGDFGATLYGNAFDAQMNRDLAALNSASNAFESGQNRNLSALNVGGNLFQGQNAQTLQAAGLLPALNDAKFNDVDRLQSLGQAQDFMSQLQLDDEIDRFNQQQNLPWQNLQNFMSIVNGVSPTQQPNLPAQPGSNSTAETLGTIGLLASLFANG